MGNIIILVVAIPCLIGAIVQAILSFLFIGLLTAWPGSIIMLIPTLSWYIAGLPLLCISPSGYITVAACLTMTLCMFGAGLGIAHFTLPFSLAALIILVVTFIISELATLITTIASLCSPKIWLQWPYRLLLGGLRLAI